jgi:alcohol dehydrogenase
MSNFQFHFPTITQCGEGLANQAGALFKPHVQGALLVVTDQGLIDAGILGGFFPGAGRHRLPPVLGGAGQPSTDVLDAAVRLLREHDCQAVIGVGGGSSIDTAKGVAAMATNPGSILDYEGYDGWSSRRCRSSPSRPPLAPAASAPPRRYSPTSRRCSRP